MVKGSSTKSESIVIVPSAISLMLAIATYLGKNVFEVFKNSNLELNHETIFHFSV